MKKVNSTFARDPAMLFFFESCNTRRADLFVRRVLLNRFKNPIYIAEFPIEGDSMKNIHFTFDVEIPKNMTVETLLSKYFDVVIDDRVIKVVDYSIDEKSGQTSIKHAEKVKRFLDRV